MPKPRNREELKKKERSDVYFCTNLDDYYSNNTNAYNQFFWLYYS